MFPEVDPEWILPQARSAIDLLEGIVPSAKLPSVGEVFDISADGASSSSPRVRPGVVLDAPSLMDLCDKKLFEETLAESSLSEKYALLLASQAMAGDWSRAPLGDARNRVHSAAFSIFARFWLGLPVCYTVCNVGQCVAQEVNPYGAHASRHVSGKVIQRHNRVVDVVAAAFRFLPQTSQRHYMVSREAPLEDLGFVQRPDPRIAAQARCDVALENEDTGMVDCLDVTVTHPDFRDVPSDLSLDANGAPKKEISAHLQMARARKMDRYCGSYEIPASQVVPLVFDTFGAWDPGTVDFLHSSIRAVAGDDDVTFSRLWMRLRYRVASALARGTAEVLLRLNYLNRRAGCEADAPWLSGSSGAALGDLTRIASQEVEDVVVDVLEDPAMEEHGVWTSSHPLESGLAARAVARAHGVSLLECGCWCSELISIGSPNWIR
jgi:hypothetical protein